MVTEIIAIALGYLLGSIPMAYIVGHLKKGGDIRQMGGGNMGALNTIREVGPAVGLAVLFADIAKGLLAVLIAHWFGLSLIWVFVVGFAAVIGHNWPIFLKFKGGKGGATTMGVLLALVPREFGIIFAIIVLIVVVTSNARLGMVIGFAFLPLIVWQFGGSGNLIIYSLVLPLFVGIRSLAEMKRAVAESGSRKGLIFDREYHFWQVRKK